MIIAPFKILRLPNALVLRNSLLFTLLAGCVLAVMGLVIRISVNAHFEEQDRLTLNGKLELISHILNEIPTLLPSVLTQQLGDAMVGHHDLVVRVDNAQNETLFISGDKQAALALHPPATNIQPADIGEDLPLHQWQVGGMAYRGIVQKLPVDNMHSAFTITIATDIAHHQMFFRTFDHELLTVGGSGLLLMGLLGWFAVRRSLKPVEEMTQVAASINAIQLEQRLPVATIPQELQLLAEAFNSMLDRLAESFQRLSAFSSDIAHELRTPINNLMTQTQVSLSQPRTADEYRETLYSNLDEYERLARMIADMLLLAKADNGLIMPHKERVSLVTEIDMLSEFYGVIAAEKSVTFSVEGSATVQGDRRMLQRALGNLLSNAIHHSTPHSQITISISTPNNRVNLAIKNQGEPIAAEHLSRLFDRFYRVDVSRQRNDEGAGLGLAITKSIVEAHGGSIAAQLIDDGIVFVINLPIDSSQTMASP